MVRHPDMEMTVRKEVYTHRSLDTGDPVHCVGPHRKQYIVRDHTGKHQVGMGARDGRWGSMAQSLYWFFCRRQWARQSSQAG